KIDVELPDAATPSFPNEVDGLVDNLAEQSAGDLPTRSEQQTATAARGRLCEGSADLDGAVRLLVFRHSETDSTEPPRLPVPCVSGALATLDDRERGVPEEEALDVLPAFRPTSSCAGEGALAGA